MKCSVCNRRTCVQLLKTDVYKQKVTVSETGLLIKGKREITDVIAIRRTVLVKYLPISTIYRAVF